MFTIVETYILNDEGMLAEAEEKDEQPHPKPTFACLVCDLPFKTQKRMNVHLKQTHPSVTVVQHDDGRAEETNANLDTVFNYQSCLLKLSLLERNFQDSIHEGDGSNASFHIEMKPW